MDLATSIQFNQSELSRFKSEEPAPRSEEQGLKTIKQVQKNSLSLEIEDIEKK